MNKSKLKSYLTYIIGWPLSIVAIYFIYTTFAKDLGNISRNIQNLNPFLLTSGIVSFVLYYFLRSFIWHKLLKELTYSLPFKETAYLWGTAQLKRYIPGNIWSFVGLTVLFSNKKVSKRDIAHALVIENQLVIIATLILSALSMTFLIENFFPNLFINNFLKSSIPICIGIAAIVYIFSGTIIKRIDNMHINHLHHILPGYKHEQTFTLLLLMTTAYILFGLGYYFTISSFLYLSPELIPVLIGLFVFSLLIGFLSFLTPTGLGVREGAITVGLSKFTTTSLAGFAAIFARIILVISEIIYIAIAYIWLKSESKSIKQLELNIVKNIHTITLFVLVAIHAIYFTVLSFLRYDNFHTGRFDLGNMTQTVWNTSRGRIFEFTNPDGQEIVSRLAFHADFILLFFAPLYWIWESPKVLLLFQAIITSLGAVFVYLIAREIIKNKNIALALSFSYLINPGVAWALLYDFHAVVLATTFLLAAVYFLIKRRYVWFIIFAVLAALTKEQVWFIISLFGPILFFYYKKKTLGITVFIASLSMFYYLLWHAIPGAAESNGHFALRYFSDGGSSPSDLIKNSVTSPNETITKLLDKDRTNYLKALFMPLGYTPLLFPFWLLFASADFALNLLSDKPELHQIYYQYTATITPFIFLSAIFAIYFVKKRVTSSILIAAYIITFALYGAYTYGPLPGSKNPNITMITEPLPNRDIIAAKLKEIPIDKSVAVTNELGAHLSHRERIYTAATDIEKADYIALFLRASDNDKDEYTIETIGIMKKNKNFELIYEEHGLTIFRKISI